MTARIQVGQIVGPHGVRGQVKIHYLTEHPEAIAAYGPLSDKTGAWKWTLTLTGRWKDGVIAALSGVSTREAAEGLKHVTLFASADALPPAGIDEYYISRLAGLEVRARDGTPLGRISATYNFGAGDILEITFADNTTAMYPFAAAFFPEIQLSEGWLRFIPPEEI